MCGRFSIISNSKILSEHFALVNSGEYISSYNITPSSVIPIIRINDMQRELANCHWGLIPHWAKDTKLKPINAKAETIMEKPFFRSSFKNKRCLIPANGFYEWTGIKGHKQPYYFKLDEDKLFAFAGLWDNWVNEDQNIESCAIITTTANEVMKPIHTRMPVMLQPDNYDKWLHEGDKTLLKPYEEKMICYPISTLVNNPKHNGSDLIEAINL